jgi:hypothetical protein
MGAASLVAAIDICSGVLANMLVKQRGGSVVLVFIIALIIQYGNFNCMLSFRTHVAYCTVGVEICL